MSETGILRRPATELSVGAWLSAHWLPAFLALYGLWVWLPWLAPLLMHAGWTGSGRMLYAVYSVFCHQLPERSFFLFGQHVMYPLPEIQAAWQMTLNPMVLRRFVGNDAMGWKVAWSDRMVSFYSSIWLAAIVWWPWRRKAGALPWWGFALLLLPMLLDGATHAVSDLAGLGRGFRDSNNWLLGLTSIRLPLAYAGDGLGSFNSWARLVSGVLAGIGVTWFAFPHLERSFG